MISKVEKEFLNEKFELLKKEFDRMDKRFEKIEKRLESIEKNVMEENKRVAVLETKIKLEKSRKKTNGEYWRQISIPVLSAILVTIALVLAKDIFAYLSKIFS